MLLFWKLIHKTQMSNPPEAASYHNSTKLLILLPLSAIYFYSLYYETPCISFCLQFLYNYISHMGICSLNYNHNKASLLVSNLFSFKCVSAMKQPSKAQTIKTKLHFQIAIFLLKIWPLLDKLYAGLLWIFYHFISFCNFWQFSAILGNLLYVSSRQYPSKSNIIGYGIEVA